jgi:hypothetical protein
MKLLIENICTLTVVAKYDSRTHMRQLKTNIQEARFHCFDNM